MGRDSTPPRPTLTTDGRFVEAGFDALLAKR
jgi:hypothetical protein